LKIRLFEKAVLFLKLQVNIKQYIEDGIQILTEDTEIMSNLFVSQMQTNKSPQKNVFLILNSFFFLAVLEFELRASYFLGYPAFYIVVGGVKILITS
jgi:hypothetical protein